MTFLNKEFSACSNVYTCIERDVMILRENAMSWKASKLIGIIEETTLRENGRGQMKTEDHWFPRLVPSTAYQETAVHYFLMSNKAISMCPDQGPQVLTRVISPGSPACATSSSERRTLLSLLLSPPLSIPSPLVPDDGAVTWLLCTPRDEGCWMLRKSENADRLEEDGDRKGCKGEGWMERNQGGEKVVSTEWRRFQGKFHKGWPAGNECYITLLML